MKDGIQKIIDGKDGASYILSRQTYTDSEVPIELRKDLVEKGILDPEVLEGEPTGTVVRYYIGRAKYLEADTPVSDTTKSMIDNIKNKKMEPPL